MRLTVLTTSLLAALGVASVGTAAAQTLPVLRTEATSGGSIFILRNEAAQPVTAFLIELVNYPGSSYTLFQDEAAADLIAPGAEKRIPVTNMTVGAVPDYVKLQAAIYADGSTAGVPEKITQLVERRKATLAAARELVARLEKAKSSATPKASVAADLKQWADSLQPAGKVRVSQATINQAAQRGVVSEAASWLGTLSLEETLVRARAAEKSLAGSKPAL